MYILGIIRKMWKNHIMPFLIEHNAWITGSVAIAIFLSSWLAIPLIALSTYIAHKRPRYDESMNSLRQKVDQIGLNMHNLFQGILVNLLDRLKFDAEYQIRASIYVHHKRANYRQGYFTCCGRHSSNPEFRGQGRITYPDGQGCIWKGWENGWHYDDEFPRNADEHKKYSADKYDVPLKIQETIRMRSRFYAVMRLDDTEGESQAVIVIEGMKKPPSGKDSWLKKELEPLAKDYARMIKVLRDNIPIPKNAEEKNL